MLIKHIVCEVAEGKRELFSHAQDQWIKIEHTPGLLWQLGGWDAEFNAHIWGIWSCEVLYEQFMKFNHDWIYNTNKQKEIHDSIAITFSKVNEVEYMETFLSLIEDGMPFEWRMSPESCCFAVIEEEKEGSYSFVESWLVRGKEH
ncbi:DUF4937 domain-containing protein [Falsibacillus pallidus]|uniref:DUF4937 domain-containing protein n=1 Tax=Falsibacillus pallidus TaxID=493781 RepID=UPI003D9663B4